MTWAEFQLRSFGFWEERKERMLLAREQAYQTFILPWRVFGKKCPYSKERFWPIGATQPRKGMLSPAQIEAAKAAVAEQKKIKNGN